jgi:hypothetical protein
MVGYFLQAGEMNAVETAIKEAKGLIASLGTYARLVVVGVWFPGFLVLCELSLLYFRCIGQPQSAPLDYLAIRIKEYNNNLITVLIVFFVLAVSIALGYVARDISFAVSDFWLRRRWPPTRTLITMFQQIQLVYGRHEVDAVAKNYHVFGLAYGEIDAMPLPRLNEAYVREYCKQWLRVNAPELNTEGLEIEINMVVGLVLPVALASIVLWIELGGLLGLIVGILALIAAAFMMYRITWSRNVETELAIVNFLFAHWEPKSCKANHADSTRPGHRLEHST